MLKEFREFALRGSVMDLAIGVVIGAAFGKIVTSFVEDVLMPPLGMLLGKSDFSGMFLNLSGRQFATLEEAKKAGAATLNYGIFLNAVVSFIIVAFAVFLVVRTINRMRKEPPPADPTTKDCPRCLSAIPIKASRCAHCTSEL